MGAGDDAVAREIATKLQAATREGVLYQDDLGKRCDSI